MRLSQLLTGPIQPPPKPGRTKAVAKVKKPPARKPKLFPPVTKVEEYHRMFVTAFLAQNMSDPAGALSKVNSAAAHNPDREAVLEEAAWLLEQPLIRGEINRQLVPLFKEEGFDRVWVASNLFQISQANIFDYFALREVNEPVFNEHGHAIIDEQGNQVFTPTFRAVPNCDFDNLPLHKQQNIKKLKITRTREGDRVEIELHDRHKAVNDIALLAGLKDADNSDALGRAFADEMTKAALRQEKLAQERRERLRSDSHE